LPQAGGTAPSGPLAAVVSRQACGRVGRRRPSGAHRRRPVPEVGRSEAVAPTSVCAIRDARISLAGACREWPSMASPVVGARRGTVRAKGRLPGARPRTPDGRHGRRPACSSRGHRATTVFHWL